MKNILIVGDHPYSATGNGNMLREILARIDFNKYQVNCFVNNQIPVWKEPYPLPFRIIPAKRGNDPWGEEHLLDVLANADIDALLMVGLDIWRYYRAREEIKKCRDKKHFKWGWIFPYDLISLRKDWVNWISILDFPCVYSLYGYETLEESVGHLRYFRPPLAEENLFHPVSFEEKMRIRARKFPSISKDAFLYGYIGANQTRKDIQRMLKAFNMVWKEYKNNVVLYLHTDAYHQEGYNLFQYMMDLNFTTGSVFAKNNNIYSRKEMAEIYQSLDCLINCTMQEGLSWTPLEAMLCGTPVIVSDTTAHPELVKDAGYLVPAQTLNYLPMLGAKGHTQIETKSCDPIDIASAMQDIFIQTSREKISASSVKTGQKWLKGVSNINALLADMTITIKAVPKVREKKILFAQHSSAGDVLMTTRCFKGLKERHLGLPLVYMTSPQYMNIIEGNPYVDEVIPWDEKLLGDHYQHVYNPHGERILPGHWGRNSNSILSDFYWKILMVEPDDFFIRMKHPNEKLSEADTFLSEKKVCIVHTTGGDPTFRTYKYMEDICRVLVEKGYRTIQVGSENDFPAWSNVDLRGGLTFQETAWVMNRASLAVTVDSFISHLAGALGVPQVCLFGSGNAHVTRPNQVKGMLVCHSPSYIDFCKGLGPCSASVRDCPTPCTGLHDPKDILQSIREIENYKGIDPKVIMKCIEPNRAGAN